MTILSVDFIPRSAAESLDSDPNLALISITEPESGHASLAEFPAVLRLVFHDIDDRESDQWTLFNDQHVRQVIEFVQKTHADPNPFHIKVHCRAGISRSAAIAIYVAESTGCDFPRRPFAGLANKLMLQMLSRASGIQLTRPRALPKKEQFQVAVERNFETGLAQVTVENAATGETAVLEGPMLDVPVLIETAVRQVWGIANPPSAHHIRNWDHLDT
jgi:hypothetical protein